MKTIANPFLSSSALLCSLILLLPAVCPAQRTVSATDTTPAPDTTFNDNVVIQTGDSPTLSLVQTGAGGLTPQTWEVKSNEISFFVGDVTNGRQALHIYRGAPTSSLDIAPSGNIGLGVSNPAKNLHIAKSLPTIRLQSTAAIQSWDLEVGSSGLFFNDITANKTSMVIRNATGNVGIGTISPAGRLHVNGSGPQLSIFQSSNNDAVQFRLQTNSINRRFVALNSSGAVQSQLLFGDNGAFDFLGSTANDVRMRLLANGNVGIGTTAPTQKLSVNGTAGKPGGGSWATFSDERLKDIKGEFTSGLNEVMKLQPIRYEYKADNAIGIQSDGEHIGFGAEAVSKVIPEAVSRNEAGYLMIDNDPILWTMLNAIKEQNAQMNAQNAQIKEQTDQMKEQNAHGAAQDKEIAQLKEQLKRLQTQVVLQGDNRKLPRKRAVAEANR